MLFNLEDEPIWVKRQDNKEPGIVPIFFVFLGISTIWIKWQFGVPVLFFGLAAAAFIYLDEWLYMKSWQSIRNVPAEGSIIEVTNGEIVAKVRRGPDGEYEDLDAPDENPVLSWEPSHWRSVRAEID